MLEIGGFSAMLQDIQPHQFNNEFKIKTPIESDIVFIFDGEKVLIDNSSDILEFTTVKTIKILNPNVADNSIYLFSVDNTSVFCSFETIEEQNNLKYIRNFELRDILPEWMTYIAATASHLANWYRTNKFCGRCAAPMEFSPKERALCCPKCDLTKYPNISPAVIVGIVDGDKILLTRYSDRPYKKLSLVAGFVEIGETLEDTIKREAMEEVGLKVKNIKYYKSQPWAFSQSLLMGFFAELEGSSAVKIDERELLEAKWYRRDEIPSLETTLSLTNEMIEVFSENKVFI